MASFCARCGAQMAPGSPSCPACGAPAGDLGAAPARQSAPPAASGPSAVRIVLIVVAVLVGLGLLGAGAFGFMVWRMAKSVHVSGNGQEMTMNTPGGRVDINAEDTFSASDLGVDIYPGAEPAKGGMRMKMPNGSMVTGVFVTSDSKDQVIGFYKSKFGDAASVMEMHDTAVIKLKKSDQESVSVIVAAKSSQNEGKTRISIAHMITNKPS